jgi:hypothetical protein
MDHWGEFQNGDVQDVDGRSDRLCTRSGRKIPSKKDHADWLAVENGKLQLPAPLNPYTAWSAIFAKSWHYLDIKDFKPHIARPKRAMLQKKHSAQILNESDQRY